MTNRQHILYHIAHLTVSGKEIPPAEEDALLRAARSENITVNEALREAALMRAGLNRNPNGSPEAEKNSAAQAEAIQPRSEAGGGLSALPLPYAAQAAHVTRFQLKP